MLPARNFYRALFMVFLLIQLSPFFYGCASGGHSRGKLSDAMKKASDRHSDDRTNRTRHNSQERYSNQKHRTKESGSSSSGGSCLFSLLDITLGEPEERTDYEYSQKKNQQTFPGYETEEEEEDSMEEEPMPDQLAGPNFSEQESTQPQVSDESDLQPPPQNTHIFKAETPPDSPEPEGNMEQLELTPIEKQKLDAQNDMEAEQEAPPIIKSKATHQPVNDEQERKKDSFVILGGGSGLIRGADFEKWNHLQIGVGDYLDEHSRLEIYLSGVWVPIRKTSTLDQSIDHGLGGFSIGGNYKFFTTPRHTFLGQYFVLGLAYNHLFWSYENPIQVGNSTIRNDNTGAVELSAGIGLHLVQHKKLQIGAEILPGVLLWNNTTYHDFENDVLSFPFVVKFRATVSILN